MFYWRVHRGLLGNRVAELEALIKDGGDVVQIIDGHWRDIPKPELPVAGDYAGLALTTIQDARQLMRGGWEYPCLLYYDKRKYDVSFWMPRIEADIPVLNRCCIFVPAGLLPYQGIHLDSPPFRNSKGHLFIRPDSGSKLFTGFVVDTLGEHLHTWSAIAQRVSREAPFLAPDDLICIAEAKELHPLEWRFWIVNGEVVASTPYSWEKELDHWSAPPPDALAIAEKMAINPWQPDIAYVVDVVQAQTSTGADSFYLNEINACSTSGLYHVLFEPLMQALRKAVLAEVAGDITLED